MRGDITLTYGTELLGTETAVLVVYPNAGRENWEGTMKWTVAQNKAFVQMSMRAFAQLTLFRRWLAKEAPSDVELLERSLPENNGLQAQLGIRIGIARSKPSKGGFDEPALNELVTRPDGVGDALLWETCIDVEVNEATGDPSLLRRKLAHLLRQFLGHEPALYSCDLQLPDSPVDSGAAEATAPIVLSKLDSRV